jgi:uncharacterized membrane protein
VHFLVHNQTKIVYFQQFFVVEERGENLEEKREVVIGLAVPLGVSLVVNCTLCLATCYYYIIYKEEVGKRKGETFLN